MIRRSVRVTPVIAALLLTTASAQQPAPPPFRFERPVVAGGAGPRRLAIDVPLLAGGEPFQVVSSRIRGAAGETSATATGGLGDLRSHPLVSNGVPTILVSGGMNAVPEGVLTSSQFLLRKPFQMSELADLVANCLNGPPAPPEKT